MWRKTLLVISMVWTAAITGYSQSPPNPWEKYNALINSDIFVKGHIMDTSIISLKGPYFRWEEQRVLAELAIDSLFFDESSAIEEGITIKVLLPSLVEFNQAPPDYNSATISFPTFFENNAPFYTALVHSTENSWYVSSSPHPQYSFLHASQGLMKEALDWRSTFNIKRNEAKEIALSHYENINPTSLMLKITGVKVREGKITELKSPSTVEFKLFWKVWDITGGKDPIYIDPIQGIIY